MYSVPSVPHLDHDAREPNDEDGSKPSHLFHDEYTAKDDGHGTSCKQHERRQKSQQNPTPSPLLVNPLLFFYCRDHQASKTVVVNQSKLMSALFSASLWLVGGGCLFSSHKLPLSLFVFAFALFQTFFLVSITMTSMPTTIPPTDKDGHPITAKTRVDFFTNVIYRDINDDKVRRVD